MGFFDLFTTKADKEFINSLHEKFHEHFPNHSEDQTIVLSCLSGLLARVAYIDFEIHDKEKQNIENALIHWMKITKEEASFVAQVSIEEMKTLAGLDARKFCTPLNEILSIEKRYQVLEALFELAASDGNVDSMESNEISYISKALVLEQKHFIAARATVKDFLKALN